MNFLQDFRAAFGDKYDFLHLKSATVDKKQGALVVIFLYPANLAELSGEQKQEITDFLKEKLNLQQLRLKVKFMRVFVEEKLIMKAILSFFEEKYKLVNTYVHEKDIKIDITNVDVKVQIELSSRMNAFFAEHKIQSELAGFLKNNFLVDFYVTATENKALLDEVDIENVEMKSSFRPVERYEVEIVKEVAGKGIPTRPEYLSLIKSPKEAVVVAGFLNKIERRDFVIKKGKREGQEKAYFTFQVQDEKGKMDCIYFCPKCYVKNLEALEEYMYVLLHGDVRLNQVGKLQLYVDKIALANKVEKKEEKKVDLRKLGKVVEIEKIDAVEQNSMFEQKNKYNSKIMGKSVVVFDIETTGLDAAVDQIIELGAVKVENGNIVEKFSTFVKPTKRIPHDVSELTGITNQMVADAPNIQNVIKDFYDFTRGCVLCGHNILGFDILFIRREAEKLGLVFDNDIIDTMNEARVSRLKISRFNLGTVTKALGISLVGAHRAWNDAFATAQVLLKLNEA